MPVSEAVGKALKAGKKGDSTGCGDNFAGGIIGSLARQTLFPNPSPSKGTGFSHHRGGLFDLKDACRWGIVSGGFACFYYGGTYFEKQEGEKFAQLQQLYDLYLKQEGVC